TLPTKFENTKDPSTLIVMRKALKNIIYSTVNSVALNGICSASTTYYDLAPWRVGLIAADCVAGAGVIALATLGVLRIVKDKKVRPEEETTIQN
ncbi:MAG: hypothetical protein HUJ60_01710, partial [Bacilli bacterium]|nr:hypothetical protein [Bacilli bacterium]